MNPAIYAMPMRKLRSVAALVILQGIAG